MITNVSARSRVALQIWACALALGSSGCGDSSSADEGWSFHADSVKASVDIDPRRWLAVTERRTLARFSFQRTMDQIVRTSGVTGQSARDLFQQWWDTQNPGPGLGLGPNCDQLGSDGTPTLNGYPLTCRSAPAAEGLQATCDPFAEGSSCSYIPVGLFMRFDLAPEDGSHCGEYRIVFAKESGRVVATDRNLLIFEAAVRNPHANQGIRGCQKLVDAWADLGATDSADARAAQLETIYFTGYREFDPVVSAFNYGDNPGGYGQVRTNQFVQRSSPRIWSLREFKIQRACSAASCAVQFVPVVDKVNPYGPLFDGSSTHDNAAGFQAELVTQVASLAAPELRAITLHTSEAFDSGQSQANGTLETVYGESFGPYASAFRTSIQGALTQLGSALTPDDVVARAQAMSCAGCHKLSSDALLGGGLRWPPSLGFTHVSERDVDLETVNGETRYRLSLALTDVLLPARKQLVEDYLKDVPRPSRGPKVPLGGRWVH